MGLTTDPTDPRLTHGVDKESKGMAETYLVLDEEERAKGFVRPYRNAYIHVGPTGPQYPLRDLTEEEKERFEDSDYLKFEEYPDSEKPKLGRFWTLDQLAAVDKGCGTVTTMGKALSETYARQPTFYGATYCVSCAKHLAVGEAGEFLWIEPDGSTGPRVGT